MAEAAHRIGLGVTYRLGAVLAFGFMAALAKLAAENGAPTMQIMFFRNSLALLPILLVVQLRGGFRRFRVGRPWTVTGYALVWMTGSFFTFAALGLLPLTEFTAITFSVPLMIAALSAPFLKEKVSSHAWLAVLTGFAGVLILVWPDPQNMQLRGVLFALGSAVTAAVVMLGMRQLSRTEPGSTIALCFTSIATLILALAMPFVWVNPDPLTWFYLAGVGVCGGVGQLMLTQAFRYAPAAVVAPFDYATALCNGLLGFWLWGELPQVTTAVGGAIVVASGLYLLWSELRPTKRAADGLAP